MEESADEGRSSDGPAPPDSRQGVQNASRSEDATSESIDRARSVDSVEDGAGGDATDNRLDSKNEKRKRPNPRAASPEDTNPESLEPSLSDRPEIRRDGDGRTRFLFTEDEVVGGVYELDVLLLATHPDELGVLNDVFGGRQRTDAEDLTPAYDAALQTPTKAVCTARILCLHNTGIEAALVAGSAIARWRPRYVILVGSAAMNPVADAVGLGDLLIATDIVDASNFDIGDSLADDPPRPQRRDVDSAELPTATVATGNYRGKTLPCDRHLLRPMQDFVERRRPSFRAASGPLVSNSRAVTDAVVRDDLFGRHGSAIGLEIGGHGVAHAVAEVVVSSRPAFGVVKAATDVSDLASTEAQRLAGVRNAATFVREFLKATALPMASGPIPLGPAFESDSTEGLRARPLADRVVDRLHKTLTLPSETERELTDTLDERLVVVEGAVGSGRKAVAIDWLLRHYPDIVELGDLTSTDQLVKTGYRSGCGYYLRVDEPIRLSEALVGEFVDRLTDANACVAVVSDVAHLVGDGAKRLPRVQARGVGDPYAALVNHVRHIATSDASANRAIEVVNAQFDGTMTDSMSGDDLANAAKLAARWVDSGEQAPPPDVFANPGQLIWERATSTEDRITILAYGVYSGLPIARIEQARKRLAERLLPEPKDGIDDPFGELESVRNARLKIETWTMAIGLYGVEVEERLAGIGTDGSATDLVQYVWNSYPQLQSDLAGWLIDSIEYGSAAEAERAALMTGTLSAESPYRFVEHPIDSWATHRHRRVRRNAGFALAAMLDDDRSAALATNLISEWSSSENERRRTVAIHATIWSSLRHHQVDSSLIAQATDFPTEDAWKAEIEDQNIWAAIDELKHGLWLSMPIAEHHPRSTANLLSAVCDALSGAKRRRQRNLSAIATLALIESEMSADRDANYGDLYLGRSGDPTLIAAVSRLAVLLLDEKVTSRWMGRVLHAWCWAALEHPTGAESARELVAAIWNRADPTCQKLLRIELGDVAKLAKVDIADIVGEQRVALFHDE
jgi:hypothetical protein